jgi:hypothetical protein
VATARELASLRQILSLRTSMLHSLHTSTLLRLAPLALSFPVLAQCPNDDWREDNDTCATPLAAVPGNQFGLVVTATDEDHFVFAVPAGRTMTVRVRFQHALGDIDAFLYDAASGCAGMPLASGTSQTNEELFNFQNTGAVDTDCVLRVTLVSGTCNQYDLGLSLTGSPISCPVADRFEPNDTIGTATHMVPGAYLWLNVPLMGSRDLYSVVVPPASTITVRAFEYVAQPADAPGLVLYNFDGTQTLDFAFAVGSTLQEVTWDNTTGAPALVNALFTFQVGSSPCLDYVLGVVVEPIDCPGPDRFEPNDACAQASGVGEGMLLDLTAPLGDVDLYSILVPAGGSIAVSATELAVAPGDLAALSLHSADCGTLLDTDAALGASMQSVAWLNQTGLDEEVRIELVYTIGVSPCIDYSLDVVVDTCGATLDDGLEDNDTCAAAGTLPLGTTVGLQVFGDDPDYYATTVPNRTTLEFAVDYDLARGDLMVELYRGNACDVLDLVAIGATTPTGQALVYTNAVGGAETYTLRVVYAGPMEGCNTYSLTADAVPGMLGNYICVGVANSTGVGAHLIALGSDAALDNALTLQCEDLPNFSNGFFLNSFDNGFVPNPGGTSSGNFCIAGPRVGRHDAHIRFSGTTGQVELTLDLTQLPQPLGPYVVLAGDLIYFQYWYRDVLPMGGTTSNLSDALWIQFL